MLSISTCRGNYCPSGPFDGLYCVSNLRICSDLITHLLTSA